MEVTIGVQNLPREIGVEVDATAEAITEQLNAALEKGGLLQLTDVRGGVVIVPAAAIGYLQIGPEEIRKVGFGYSG